MAATTYTYDHTKVNIALNGLPLTDFIDNITVSENGEDFSVTEGLNDNVLYSRRSNNVVTVTLPMIANSPQFVAIKGFRLLQRNASSVPFPFAMIDLNNGDSIMGNARIMSLGEKTVGVEATGRSVVLSVVKSLEG